MIIWVTKVAVWKQRDLRIPRVGLGLVKVLEPFFQINLANFNVRFSFSFPVALGFGLKSLHSRNSFQLFCCFGSVDLVVNFDQGLGLGSGVCLLSCLILF
jgi:hypothetical protein